MLNQDMPIEQLSEMDQLIDGAARRLMVGGWGVPGNIFLPDRRDIALDWERNHLAYQTLKAILSETIAETVLRMGKYRA